MLSTSVRRPGGCDRRTRTSGRRGSALAVRARRALAVAVCVPVLALSTAACGSGGDGAADGNDGQGKRTSKTSGGSETKSDTGDGPVGGESAAERKLAAALLKSGDVKGYQVQRSKKDALPQQNTVVSQDPECSPITDALSSDPERTRIAYTNGVIQKGSSPAGSGAVQQVLLASYGKGGAQKWMAELKEALGRCDSFTAKDGAGDRTRLRVERGASGTVGDDSVEFTLRVEKQNDAPLAFTIVRTGASTASFLSISMSRKPRQVEKSLVVEQHRKLTALGGS